MEEFESLKKHNNDKLIKYLPNVLKILKNQILDEINMKKLMSFFNIENFKARRVKLKLPKESIVLQF